MKIKAIIVDDDKRQQEILEKKILAHCPQIALAGMASNVPDGVKLIKEQKPQLVFLDVEMPPLTGFDLLKTFSPVEFEVIFVTAFTDFAYKAFKVAAVDYLHKPFLDQELVIAVAKAEEKIVQKAPNAIHHLLNNINNNTVDNVKIGLPTLSGITYVRVKDIMHIEGANEYCRFHFMDKPAEMISKKMGEIEEVLKEYNFYRIHKSHIVNLSYVKQYLRGEGGQVCLTDNTMLNVSKNSKEGFLAAMRNL